MKKRLDNLVDPRLDYIPQYDPQSKAYSVANTDAVRNNTSVNPEMPYINKIWAFRNDPNNLVLNQGKEGACVGFGLTHALLTEPMNASGLFGEVTDLEKFAIESIYWEAQKIDKIPGGAYPGASPKGSGTSILAGLKVLKKYRHIDEYHWAFSLHDMILGVCYFSPAIIGIPWYQGMYKPDKNFYISPSGKKVGGHCCLVIAVHAEKRKFTIINSWGSEWGWKGLCSLSFDDMGYLIDEGADIAFIHNPYSKFKMVR